MIWPWCIVKMNELKNHQKNSGKALVGVVVEIPFDSEHDMESQEIVKEIANSKLAQDVIAALIGGVLAHKYETGTELKAWHSTAISEVSGIWTELNG